MCGEYNKERKTIASGIAPEVLEHYPGLEVIAPHHIAENVGWKGDRNHEWAK